MSAIALSGVPARRRPLRHRRRAGLSPTHRCVLSMVVLACLGAAPCLEPSVARAADVRPNQARIPTVTRLVKTFTDLETTLTEKLSAGDAAAVEALLTEDFEMRSSNRPGSPTPRADWIRESRAAAIPAARIEQMAVHDLDGGFAVVSYLQARTDGARRDRVQDLFVVDVWKRAGTSWQLATRYAGPAGSPDLVIPGSAREEPAPPKRY